MEGTKSSKDKTPSNSHLPEHKMQNSYSLHSITKPGRGHQTIANHHGTMFFNSNRTNVIEVWMRIKSNADASAIMVRGITRIKVLEMSAHTLLLSKEFLNNVKGETRQLSQHSVLLFEVMTSVCRTTTTNPLLMCSKYHYQCYTTWKYSLQDLIVYKLH